MFASRYWPDRYYAPRYWPKIGADPPPVVTTVPVLEWTMPDRRADWTMTQRRADWTMPDRRADYTAEEP